MTTPTLMPTPPPSRRGRQANPRGPGRDADHVCDACGYGVRTGLVPERCPMCGGRSWRLARRLGPAARRNPSSAAAERPGPVLRLTGEERQALLTVLYVVRDNWWLNEVEERILQRLELTSGDPDPLAA